MKFESYIEISRQRFRGSPDTIEDIAKTKIFNRFLKEPVPSKSGCFFFSFDGHSSGKYEY